MKAKYVETSDPEIIRQQLEHAEKCGVRWMSGASATSWHSCLRQNIGYSNINGVLISSCNDTTAEPVTLEEWCEWISELTGYKEKSMITKKLEYTIKEDGYSKVFVQEQCSSKPWFSITQDKGDIYLSFDQAKALIAVLQEITGGEK